MFSIKAYSKINFGLKVFDKKKCISSKHRINSIFILNKGLFDLIEIHENEKFSITYFLKSKKILIKDCIVKKTIKYFQKKYSIDINMKIIINKNIPIGSGLGGGSSCAASIANFIINKFNIKKIDYFEIAEKLGSDIPFFISKFDYALVKNIGDKVKKIKMRKFNYYLFIPSNIICDTKQVYQKFDLRNYDAFIENITKITKKSINAIIDNNIIINSLQQSAFDIYPNLINHFNSLVEKYDYVTLSGSGCAFVCLNKEDLWK